MPDPENEPYSMEGSPGGPPEPPPEAVKEPEAPKRAEPLAVEESSAPSPPPDDEEPESIRALDVCPNCGAPMRSHDGLRCVRCGYDLKTMQVVEAPEAEANEDAEPEAIELGEPLVRPWAADPWLPAAVAGAAAAVFVVGLLAGASGLFPAPPVEDGAAAATVPWTERFISTGRWAVLVLLWTGCGIGAVIAAARLLERQRGDLRVLALRVLAIMTVLSLARFISLSSRSLEFVAEAAVEVVTFLLLGMLAFRLAPREATTVLALTVSAFVALWAIAHVVMWVT